MFWSWLSTVRTFSKMVTTSSRIGIGTLLIFSIVVISDALNIIVDMQCPLMPPFCFGTLLVWDERGCRVCCPPSICCPAVQCDQGFMRMSAGCPVCCPPVFFCPQGSYLDLNGCTACCPDPGGVCWFGFQTDFRGCRFCCTTPRCGRACPRLSVFCPFGTTIGADGCPRCIGEF